VLKRRMIRTRDVFWEKMPPGARGRTFRFEGKEGGKERLTTYLSRESPIDGKWCPFWLFCKKGQLVIMGHGTESYCSSEKRGEKIWISYKIHTKNALCRKGMEELATPHNPE